MTPAGEKFPSVSDRLRVLVRTVNPKQNAPADGRGLIAPAGPGRATSRRCTTLHYETNMRCAMRA